MERPLQRFEPERQKLVEHGEPRAQVIILPDEGLQQGRMIWKPIEDLSRGQTISFELSSKVLGSHDVCALRFPGHDFASSPPTQTSTKIRNCSQLQGVSSKMTGVLTISCHPSGAFRN